MRKAIVVAVREYQAAVRTKAFLVTLVAMPVLMGGSIAVQTLLRNKVDTRDKRFAVLDRTGELYDTIVAAAARREAEEVYQGEGAARKKVKPSFQIERAEVGDADDANATFELSQRVLNGEIFGFVVIAADALNPDAAPGEAVVRYHSNTPTYDDFQDWLIGPLNLRIQEIRFREAHLDAQTVRRATRPVGVSNLGLVSRDASGALTKAQETSRIAKFLVPFGLMMLMFMIVMVSATPLTQSVLEEKMQRIAEVLLGSIGPFQLMMGKLVGTVGVALTLGTFYLVGAYVALQRSGYGQFFPAHLVWWFVLFVALAVLMYGSLFIAIGAAVTDLKEQQSMMTPVTVLVVSPMFVWLPVLREPNSTFALVLSLIPPATPMLMTIRQAVPPGIPLWQPLAGVLLVLLTTVAFVFAAGRIFRVGILMQGRGANFADLLRWVVRG
jgi:ABC-2 type transport system permease protein